MKFEVFENNILKFNTESCDLSTDQIYSLEIVSEIAKAIESGSFCFAGNKEPKKDLLRAMYCNNKQNFRAYVAREK